MHFLITRKVFTCTSLSSKFLKIIKLLLHLTTLYCYKINLKTSHKGLLFIKDSRTSKTYNCF